MKMAAFRDCTECDMESHPEKRPSPEGQNKALTEEVRILRYTCSSILNDELFMIPGEASELCVRMSKSLINSLSNPSQCSLQFATWLICGLQGIMDKCKRKSGIFNQEKLWSTFQQTTLSSSFEEKWATYLMSVGLAEEPLFYQHITDKVFNLLIKQNVTIPDKESMLEEYEDLLTFEEENAVQYVSGYILQVLKRQMHDSDVLRILNEFIKEDKKNQDRDIWIGSVDRGGLIMITEEVYQLFYAIETCVRRYLRVSSATEMNDGFRKHVTDCTVNDENVLFYWSLAGQDEYDKTCQHCLLKLVEKWLTIHGFSFAKNLMEIYEQSEKRHWNGEVFT